MNKIVKLQRYPGNPILTPNPNNPWEGQNVSNAGATIHDGKVHLLYRCESFTNRTGQAWPEACLGLAISSDGFNFERFDEPAMVKNENDPYEEAVEDARIAKIDDTYYITYTCTSGLFGDNIALATTKDFKTFQRHGLLTPHISQRTSGLFPKKINGRYALMHRIAPSLWICFSDDLKNWTDYSCLLNIKAGTWYDRKLGMGATPIEQDDAWLLFWHAKDSTGGPYGTYRLGIMWLDKDDPTKIIKFQEEPILEVELEMEKKGFWDNVVYTCGAVELNGQYLVYYGCADRVLSVATVPVADCRL